MRDWWRLKLQRMNKWISQLAHDCLARSLPAKRATCRAHDWKMKGCARLYVFASISLVRPSHEGLAKLFVWRKIIICFTMSLPTWYIPSLPTNCNECFLERNPYKYTWELEIVIPTIIYTFLCGFPQTPTSPSLDPWEVVSPNTYHTHIECKVRFWCYWEVLEEAIH